MTRNLEFMNAYGVEMELRKTDPELADVLAKDLKEREEYTNRLFREAADVRRMINLSVPNSFNAKREYGKKPIKFGTIGNRIPLRINKDRYPKFTGQNDPNLEKLHQMLWAEEHISQALEGVIALLEYSYVYHPHNYIFTHGLASIRNSLEILVDPERWEELDDAIKEYRQQYREKLLKGN